MASPAQDATPLPATEAPDPPVIFRPKKKRPTLRSRQDDAGVPDATGAQAETGDNAPDKKDESDDDDQEVSVAELLRQRRKQQARLKGVGLPPEKPPSGYGAGEDNLERGIVAAAEAMSPDTGLATIPSRFAPQTGLVGDLVNKHMMEYVESKLASRHAPPSSRTHPDQASSLAPTPASTVATDGQKPTTLGKLMEVDLGDEARSRNVALTERAQRRLAGGGPGDEDESAGGGRAAPGRTKGGGRNRRGSDDLKRDQLVEQFLHENRPDLNIPIEEPAVPQSAPDDIPADDRIAEEFKREFLDAVARRRQKRRAARPAPRPGDKRSDGDVLKGPKLGGSRNVRSAVRDILLQQEKEKGRLGAGRR
ncbi:uncharacterized protein DNG_00709 [Cephalotrichum gorgonifer]|uniref:mRNA splicing factor RNA helicase n=1 Tax=Cephalotrichum gorgonifer TaxID=2041049 RepID=A0AAE8SRG3_9PEZI|nr:uncharacterized protein DNG_00709 [Cephalotrichum gorgonifer]